MEIKSKSETAVGWMVIEDEEGTEYLVIGGNKVAQKKGSEVFFHELAISSMAYRCALTKFLLLSWKDIVEIRDKQLSKK